MAPKTRTTAPFPLHYSSSAWLGSALLSLVRLLFHWDWDHLGVTEVGVVNGAEIQNISLGNVNGNDYG